MHPNLEGNTNKNKRKYAGDSFIRAKLNRDVSSEEKKQPMQKTFWLKKKQTAFHLCLYLLPLLSASTHAILCLFR